jgi:hypothetical protein
MAPNGTKNKKIKRGHFMDITDAVLVVIFFKWHRGGDSAI